MGNSMLSGTKKKETGGAPHISYEEAASTL